MLSNGKKGRSARAVRRFSDDSLANPESLGCHGCPEYELCGGLHAVASAFDCRDYCCGQPASCDTVCVRNGSFVARVREVGGFAFELNMRGPLRPPPSLPPIVPLLYHGSSRASAFAPPVAALPLYKFIDRSGSPRFRSRADLCNHFHIAPSTRLVLSGTADDRPLERWWSLGIRRPVILEVLRDIGIEVVTTPNYSLFSDVPRWDDLHSMKRIAIVWQEMIDAGLTTALHLNARTRHDWRRWRDFVAEREEVNCLAFEFATGAADPSRMRWHLDQLVRLATEVRRPLALLVRGGNSVLTELRQAYAGVSLLDTTAFMKAVKRQQAYHRHDGTLSWRRAADGISVDEVLEHNWLELGGVPPRH